MSMTSAVMPLCFGASSRGVVRARHRPQSANCAYDVHTFWPLTTQPVSRRVAYGARRHTREIASGAGLAEQLAPQFVGAQDVRQPSRRLFGCRVGEQRRTDEVDADPADELRCPRSRQLLLHDEVMQRTRAPAAVLDRPGDADEVRVRELSLPRAQERDLVGEIVEARRQPSAVLPRKVSTQPGAASRRGTSSCSAVGVRSTRRSSYADARVRFGLRRAMDFELSEDQQALRDAAREAVGRPRRASAGARRSRCRPAVRRRTVEGDGRPGVDGHRRARGCRRRRPRLGRSGGSGRGGRRARRARADRAVDRSPSTRSRDTSWSDRLLAGDVIACVAASGRREVVPYAPSADVGGVPCAVTNSSSLIFVRSARRASRPWTSPARSAGSTSSRCATCKRSAVAMRWTGSSTAVRPRTPPSCSAASQHMLDESTEYAKDRVQFDQPIGSFQAVKHRLADMLVDVEGMRSAVYWAAWCIAAGSSRRLGGRIDREGVVLRRGEARDRHARCRSTAASASRGSTTCTCT